MKRALHSSALLRVVRVGRVVVALYVGLAILYTSHILFQPLLRSALAKTRLPGDYKDSLVDQTSTLFDTLLSSFPFGWIQHQRPRNTGSYISMPVAKHNEDIIYWDTSTSARAFGGAFAKQDDITMPASLFLAKAFSASHEHLAHADTNNLDVIPYYYRAAARPAPDDVTITTLVTRDRFTVLRQLVERYRGPVSVTVHVSRAELERKDGTDTEMNFLDALHSLYASSPLMARLVDVHLVLTPARADRQFNAWRNAARLFARTHFVLMLDVDFVPCTDLRARVRSLLAARGPLGTRLRSGTAALVIPAFEYTDPADEAGTNVSAFPRTKQELVALYNASRVTMFHAGWPPGHNSTDYTRALFEAAPGEVYRIPRAHYQPAYEPYVIFRRDAPASGTSVPWCDERFVGYGGNKAACLYEMYMSGVSFYVLSDDFLVHRAHPYDERARRRERRANRRIYADFREEVCLRYLTAFRNAATLAEERALNAIEECKKIKGVARVAAMVRPILVCIGVSPC
ncbi:hypothetical protein EW145_g4497 [Phellinidium pouzarii]|uniref:Glycosyltransferase family 49 protein n=1 Tax=Phellinidium pouzarii TaxID=167371 RepID=A0A4S4L858_9AGAM|nr:hypothetical protein EW145_g4497 [Phellinidium pouzarii]